MLGITLTLALLPAPVVTPVQEAPPGLVLVKGGKTKIGSDVKDVEPLVLQNRGLRNALASETPQITVDVDDFLLMPTEVTNEQYAEFVRATGAKPPWYWGRKDDVAAARLAFAEEDKKRRDEAFEKTGERLQRGIFDQESWWAKNWEGLDWEVPSDRLDQPVVYVTYSDAEDYAAWAGMRLMTEFEFQRAARGNTSNPYPWGDEWEDQGKCLSMHAERDSTASVGSFPDGAVNGIFDLSGNVWEWTSSPFEAYKGYKPLKVKDGRGKRAPLIEGLAGFDPNMRVVVSGSYKQDHIGVRVTTRRGTERKQSTDAMGFRCAASTQPGADRAAGILRSEIKFEHLPDDTEFAPENVVLKQRWKLGSTSNSTPNYAVIQGHEYAMFCPVTNLPYSNPASMGKESAAAPLPLGFLSLTTTLAEPVLDAGTYVVYWRGAGKLPRPSKEEEEEQTGFATKIGPGGQDQPPFWETPGFDPEKDCFLLYNTYGEAQAAFEAKAVTAGRLKDRGQVLLEPFVMPAKLPKNAPPPVPMDTVIFDLKIAGKSKTKGFEFKLPIKVGPKVIDDTWK